MSQDKPFRFGSTFAERQAARVGSPDVKQIDADAEADEVEDKAVTSPQSKRTARKKS